MRNSKSFNRIISGIAFTFTCIRSVYTGFDGKKVYSHSWRWGPDAAATKMMAIGGTESIKRGIKYQVKAYSL